MTLGIDSVDTGEAAALPAPACASAPPAVACGAGPDPEADEEEPWVAEYPTSVRHLFTGASVTGRTDPIRLGSGKTGSAEENEKKEVQR